MRKIIQSFVAICLAVPFFIIPVKASDPSYYALSANTCLTVDAYNNPSQSQYKINIVTSSSTRCVMIHKNSGYSFIAVSDSSFTYKTSTTSCPADPNGNTSNTQNVEGNTYYTALVSRSYNNDPYVPEHDLLSGKTDIQTAIYYTFGEGADDPVVAPTWGNPNNTGYYTKIAGQGQAAINNIDTITWDPAADDNGNEYTLACKVQIRVVPGVYSGSSIGAVMEQTYNDFITDTLHLTDLDQIDARLGKFSVSWGEVIDILDFPFSAYHSVINNNGTYIKRGWIYQIRLVNEDDEYEGQWKTIYTATSSGVENDLIIIDAEYNQTLINVINIINRRNDTDNNWYIGDITIIINPTPDPSASPDPGGGGGSSNWLLDLIESILAFLGGLIGKLLELILSLFRLDSFDIPWFNDFKIQFKSNAGLFGQTLDFITDVKTIFTGTSYSDPIVTYPGIVLDGVQIVPAGSWNLNDYVTQFGLTDFRSTAYICTDGVIYISLLILTYRRLLEGLGGRRK